LSSLFKIARFDVKVLNDIQNLEATEKIMKKVLKKVIVYKSP
jgi:hypothetical protein